MRSPRGAWGLARSIEFDTIEEGREDEILLRAIRSAILEVFRRGAPMTGLGIG